MLTPPGYPTAPSHTQNPSDVEHDIEQACKTFKNEILQVSRAESGLHFNASQARTADILSFNLEDITQTFNALAPCPCPIFHAPLDPTPHQQTFPPPSLP